MSKNKIIDFKDISKIEESNKNEKKSIEKTKNRINFKNIILLAIVVIATVYPLAYIANQMVAIANLNNDIAKLESELESTKKKNKEIQSEIDNSKSSEFIEKMAREKLKMVKKDEIVYIKIDWEVFYENC